MAEMNTAGIGFEKQIWDAACVLHGNIDASEYKSVVLGLIFLKYISDRFDEKHQQLVDEGDGFEEDVDEYISEGIFFVPENARWSVIASKAHTAEIGTVIDDAMRAIEKENKRLKDILPKNFARPELDKRRLGDVVDLFTNIKMVEAGEADGIPTKLGKKKWRVSVIRSILTNEKYTGNAILGKTYKPDVLTKYRKKNNGQAPMYYVEGTHPAIIDKEMLDMAQKEMERRKDTADTTVGSSRYSSKYPFSGLLICSECGHTLRRHVRTVGSRKTVPAWGCSNRISNGRAACDSHHVNEDTLQRTYLVTISDMIEDAEDIMEAVRESAGLVM